MAFKAHPPGPPKLSGLHCCLLSNWQKLADLSRQPASTMCLDLPAKTASTMPAAMPATAPADVPPPPPLVPPPVAAATAAGAGGGRAPRVPGGELLGGRSAGGEREADGSGLAVGGKSVGRGDSACIIKGSSGSSGRCGRGLGTQEVLCR